METTEGRPRVTGPLYHHPVLLQESLDSLALTAGDCVLDATLGGGGHAEAILERVTPGGRLLGLDVDDEAIAHARERLAHFGGCVLLVHSSFRALETVLREQAFPALNAALFDLGVSSRQLDKATRGFSFRDDPEAPLDMRMDRSLGTSAADLLATASAGELTRCFQEYGELPGAGKLAREIVETRKRQPLLTASDLLACVERAGVGRGRRHHPATLVFQALRIAVNDELAALEEGLDAAIAALAPGGRLAVIAYHSLEDRRVKTLFRDEARGCICPPQQPICTCGRSARLVLEGRRATQASEAEVARNPRARSARLRVATRLPVAA